MMRNRNRAGDVRLVRVITMGSVQLVIFAYLQVKYG